jgi:hypothetical protein
MIPEKYAAQGFEISKFGSRSSAIRFNKKAIFIFNSNIKKDLVENVCETYLNICKKRTSPIFIKGQNDSPLSLKSVVE